MATLTESQKSDILLHAMKRGRYGHMKGGDLPAGIEALPMFGGGLGEDVLGGLSDAGSYVYQHILQPALSSIGDALAGSAKDIVQSGVTTAVGQIGQQGSNISSSISRLGPSVRS